MNEVILYHAYCNDGSCAAALMQFAKTYAKVFPISYGKEPETIAQISDSISDSNVYIVDFCLSEELLKHLVDKLGVKSITIIDHHETAQSLIGNFASEYQSKVDFRFIFDKSESGASLTLKYLIDNDFGITVPPSYFYYIVSMVKDRDLWKFELPSSAAFAEYLFSCKSAYSELLNLFQDGSNADVEECINYGRILLESKNEYVERKLEKFKPIKHTEFVNGVEVEFVVINETREDAVSQLGNAIVNKYNCIAYLYSIVENGDENSVVINVSLRGADHLPSCADIAKHFGGGGHRNDSGYTFSGKDVTLSQIFR